MSHAPEIRDNKAGIVAKVSERISVGHANQNRAVVISFDDLGVVVAISPANAKRLAGELIAEADALRQ